MPSKPGPLFLWSAPVCARQQIWRPDMIGAEADDWAFVAGLGSADLASVVQAALHVEFLTHPQDLAYLPPLSSLSKPKGQGLR